MAIRIELWVDDRLVGGTEDWWDLMDITLPDERMAEYPLLNRVDPYDNVTFVHGELNSLAAELRSVLVYAPEGLKPLIGKLIELCATGEAARDARLKFLGD